jgi:hypothetical protein
MNNCSNCQTQFTHVVDSVVVMQGTEVIACLCPECVSGVKKAKVVLVRGADGTFEYEQYAALEMEQKAFGKMA